MRLIAPKTKEVGGGGTLNCIMKLNNPKARNSKQ
jgi:hypothetical protein